MSEIQLDNNNFNIIVKLNFFNFQMKLTRVFRTRNLESNILKRARYKYFAGTGDEPLHFNFNL